MSKKLIFLLILLCCTAAAQNKPALASQSRIYISHVTVIDTETGKEATDQTVVISDGKIFDVRNSKNLAVPTSSRAVDGRGKYLIPGLWDMHVHRTEYESTYPIYLANGVTGVREMAGPQDANKFRAELAKKDIAAPHIYLASPIIDGYPPRWPDQIAVRNAAEARAVVDEQKQNGADFIKVYDRLSRESYFAIIDEARRQQIPVVGHVPFAISAWEASTSGQKSIEHLHAFPLACASREAELRARLVASPNSWKLWNAIYMEAYQSYDDAKCQRLVAEFRWNGTWIVPTLVVFRSSAFSNDPQFRNDDRLRYFSGHLRNSLGRRYVAERASFDDGDFAVERELYTRRKALVGALFRAGASLLAGTDVPNPFVFPGFGLHDELALLVESGVTPLGALQSATRNPALFLGIADKYGSVSPGKVADLVLLNADPLVDIHNTTKISEVFLAGKEFDRAALDLTFKNAEREANGSLKLPPAEAQTNPFVGTWKLVPEHSHFDRAAPKDITLRFLIDNGELTEQEQVILSNGSTRTTIFIPQYDGLEHSFSMSGETKHKSHAVLWTRVDDRTIERRINHDNGLEYTTERLSASPDGQTLTETHSGKHPDGTPYETAIVLQRDSKNPSVTLSPVEQEVWDQEESYWRSLKANDREIFLKLWDERFMGWARWDSAPTDKQRIRQDFASGTDSRGRVQDYKLEQLSVREYGKGGVIITFYRVTALTVGSNHVPRG